MDGLVARMPQVMMPLNMLMTLRTNPQKSQARGGELLHNLGLILESGQLGTLFYWESLPCTRGNLVSLPPETRPWSCCQRTYTVTFVLAANCLSFDRGSYLL